MNSTSPTILVTNDDGVSAPGLRALVEAMKELGTVVVVAPDKPQSGMGHAITIGDPLRIEKVHLFGEIEAYQCSGTPVDCVKLAKDKILHRNPDLCVSGVNHGSNSSINVIYSGTMSAAVEACIESIPAIGFSLLDYSFEADFTAAKHFATIISRGLMKHGLPKGTLLNVNIPKLSLNDIKGARVCRQANAKWEEDYDERVDPRGNKYYWLTGKFESSDNDEGTDEWALQQGYVSVVPVMFDLTSKHGIAFMEKEWEW